MKTQSLFEKKKKEMLIFVCLTHILFLSWFCHKICQINHTKWETVHQWQSSSFWVWLIMQKCKWWFSAFYFSYMCWVLEEIWLPSFLHCWIPTWRLWCIFPQEFLLLRNLFYFCLYLRIFDEQSNWRQIYFL